MDPHNWQVAYAVGTTVTSGSGVVFATVNGGKSWTNITGNLAPFNAVLDAVQLIKLPPSFGFPFGQDALLVGGNDGVFVTYNPLGVPNAANTYQRIPANPSGITWAAWNTGLPHARVTQISYTPEMMLNVGGTLNTPTGNVLLVSTLGRGVYVMDNASTVLAASANANVLTITGPQAGATVVIQPDVQNPELIDVAINGVVSPANRYPAQSISRINVSDLGPGSTLTINTALSLLNSVAFNGSGNENLAFQTPPSQTATTQSNKLTGNSRKIVIHGPNGFLTVNSTNGAGPPMNLPPDPPIDWIGQGLADLPRLPSVSGAQSAEHPGPGTTLGDVLDGVATITAVTDPDAGSRHGHGAERGEWWPWAVRAALRGGPGAFDLSAIGSSTIPDFATLQQDLLGLSDPSDPGSVTYGGPATGDVQFDATINKTLDGTTDLDLEALGGTVSLTGSVDVSMMVHVHLIFGVDSEGFYIDTDLGHQRPGPAPAYPHGQRHLDQRRPRPGRHRRLRASSTSRPRT